MDTIRTARLLLRRPRPGDLAAMHRILSDPTAMRYWSSLPHASIDETRTWLDAMIDAPASESCDFIVDLDGEAIGKAGCHRLPEIGYILHQDHWGRGYAAEALAAVIPHIFAAHDIPTLRADVDPRNRTSVRLLERLGFKPAGSASRTWLIGEEYCDSLYFELKRP